MGAYSENFYGVSVSKVFRKLPDDVQDAFDKADAEDWGATMYDGGGYGQISYIGVGVPRSPKGYVVTDEIEAKARKAYEKCPENVRKAVCEALRVEALPEPSFETEEGWG